MLSHLQQVRAKKLLLVKQCNAVFVEVKTKIEGVEYDSSSVCIAQNAMYRKANGKMLSVPVSEVWYRVDSSMIRPIIKQFVSRHSSIGGAYVTTRSGCIGYYVNAEDKKKILAEFANIEK